MKPKFKINSKVYLPVWRNSDLVPDQILEFTIESITFYQDSILYGTTSSKKFWEEEIYPTLEAAKEAMIEHATKIYTDQIKEIKAFTVGE